MLLFHFSLWKLEEKVIICLIFSAKHERVFPFDDNFKVTFFDDLDILPNGDLVISEASTKYPFHKLMAEVLESTSNGR